MRWPLANQLTVIYFTGQHVDMHETLCLLDSCWTMWLTRLTGRTPALYKSTSGARELNVCFAGHRCWQCLLLRPCC